MKPYKIKAVVYPLIGVGHVVFYKYLPSAFLAGMIAMGCFVLGMKHIDRWWHECP